MPPPIPFSEAKFVKKSLACREFDKVTVTSPYRQGHPGRRLPPRPHHPIR